MKEKSGFSPPLCDAKEERRLAEKVAARGTPLTFYKLLETALLRFQWPFSPLFSLFLRPSDLFLFLSGEKRGKRLCGTKGRLVREKRVFALADGTAEKRKTRFANERAPTTGNLIVPA